MGTNNAVYQNIRKEERKDREGGDGKVFKPIIARDFIFNSRWKKSVWRPGPPGPTGGAKTFPKIPYPQWGQGREHSLTAVRGTLRRKGKWKCVEWAEMNEKGHFKTRHRQ